MNNFLRKYWKIIIFTFSIILFVFVSRLLLLDEIQKFDDAVFSFVSQFRCPALTYLFKFFSFLCSIYFLVILTIGMMLFTKNKKKGFYIGLNVLLCFSLNQIFKFSFARDRPVAINLIVENGYSFPSGHSMVSLAFYGFLIYLIAHKKMKRKRKVLYCSLLSLLVFLIGISRIYLGVHFASDVLAGFALSMSYLILYIQFFYKKISDS